MKSLLLALLSFVVYMGVYGLVIRFVKSATPRGLFFPLVVSVAVLPVYFAVYWYTPNDLGGLPAAFLANHTLVDFFNGVGVYLLLSIGFTDVLIAAVTQPFSTDLLMLIAAAGEAGASYQEMLNAYSDAAGLRHIFQKRFDFLVRHAYIVVHDRQVSLTIKGLRMARMISILERFC